jgi:hypothetical protein
VSMTFRHLRHRNIALHRHLGRAAVVLIVAATAASAQTTPASETFAINSALRAAYVSVRDTAQPSVPVRSMADTLQQNLRTLMALDGPLMELANSASALDGALHQEAERNRALAWIHAWALFSKVAVAADETPSDALTQDQLFAMHTPEPVSVLALLLRIHSQISRAEDAAEPLQALLADDYTFSFQLAYRHPWRGRRPAYIRHDNYIPTHADLLGAPDDDATLNRDRILSLWAIVNSRIDAWQTLELSDATSRRPGTVISNSAQFARTANWLRDLASSVDLDSMSRVPPIRAALRTRLNRTAAFLTFRERMAAQGNLERLVVGLSALHLQQESDPRQLLGDLIGAATPVSDSPQDMSVHAAIWLRYVLLLSFRERAEAGIGNVATLLEKLWLEHGLPGSFQLSPTSAGLQVAHKGFVRWGRWPVADSFDAVIGDVARATYAYLQFRNSALGQEAMQAAAGDRASRASYAATLTQRLKTLVGVQTALDPYFSQPSPFSAYDAAFPSVLASPASSSSTSFRRTATAAEQTRALADLSAVRLQLATEISLNTVVIDAYKHAETGNTSLALSAIGGLTPLSSWNVYNLPRKSFSQYKADLDTSVKLLKGELDRYASQRDLTSTFHQRRLAHSEARHDLAAARLGESVASEALAIGQTFRTIAQLDIQIADLQKMAGELDLRGARSQQEADGLRRKQADRLRELAAAKVEALTVASQQAASLVETAVQQLEQQRSQLLTRAQQIRNKKERDSTFGLINAIITVVGAALAPFTAGSSLAIASQVTQLVSTINRVTQTDWSNFGQAVATVQQLGNQIQSAGQVAMSLGVAVPQGVLSDYKQFLTAADAAARDYGDPIRELTSALRGLNNQDSISTLTSAIASGMPFALDEGTKLLRIKLGSQQVLLGSQALQHSLSVVLSSGAMLVNDSSLRSGPGSRLRLVTGVELKAELKQAFNQMIRPLPSELLVAPPADGVAALERARAALAVAIDGLPDADAAALAQAISAGMLLVRDQATGKIVAVEGATSAELQRFRDRLNNYGQRVATGLISNTATAIRQTMSEVQAKAQVLADNQDDQGLSQYAGHRAGELAQKLGEVKQQLSAIEQELRVAHDELEDRSTEATIAQYTDEASRFFSQAAELRVDEAELRRRRSTLTEDAAVAELRRLTLVRQAAAETADARVQRVEAAELSLRQAYLACLAQGIDPLSPVPDARVESDAPRLTALLYGTNDPGRRAGAAKLADSVSGMLSWLNLLKLDGPQGARTFVERYSEFAKYVQSNDLVGLGTLGQTLTTTFSSQTDGNVVRLRSDASRNVTGAQLRWLDSVSAQERREWLAPLPPKLRSAAVAAFTFTVALDADAADPSAVLIYGADYSYYAVLNSMNVTTEPTRTPLPSLGYYVYVVPPQNAMANPADVANGLSIQAKKYLADPMPIAINLAEAAQTSQLEEQVLRGWRELDLSAALGQWKFYVLSSPAPTGDQWQALRNMTLRLFMPYISVRR